MKKYILVLILILLLSLLIKNEQTIPVINYDDYEYSMYILEFPNRNISTNNLETFKDIQIIWVYPYINKIYEKQINYKYYYFEGITLKENILKFKKSFIDCLNNNGYRTDAMNYQINGIKIFKMKIYAKESEIKNIDIENIVYKKER